MFYFCNNNPTIQSASQATATTDATASQAQRPIHNTTNTEQLITASVNIQTELENSITTIDDRQIQNTITHQANQTVYT